MTNDILFDVYSKELIEWNKKFNLTSVTGPDEIKVRHFEDSLSVLQAVDLRDERVVDIGAGAGFPGIPLKIERPGIVLTLIDSTRKKVNFLNHMIEVLKLENAEAVWGRAEELSKDPEYHGLYDVALARAVAKLPELIGYAVPFLKKGGVFVAQKQDDVAKELKDSERALKNYSAKVREVKKVKVGGALRSLIVVAKV